MLCSICLAFRLFALEMINRNKFCPVVLYLSFLFISCSQTVTLEVIVDDPVLRQNRQPVNVYLLNPKNNLAIEQIRSMNQPYLSMSLLNAKDSLRILYRDFQAKETIYQQLSSEVERNKSRLTVEYRENLKSEVIRIQKNDNVWKFWAKITNAGPEAIDGVYLTLFFNKDRLVKSGFFPIELPPNQSGEIDQINLDLSQNYALDLRLSSHPGGFAKLPGTIDCRIDSVKSDFKNYLGQNMMQLNIQRRDYEEIGLSIDDYPARKCLELQQRVANPINRVLEDNLKNITTLKVLKTSQDTARYTDLKKGQYTIVAYTNPASASQWQQTINLESDQLIKFTPKTRKQYFFQIKEEMFSFRPSQNTATLQTK